MPTIIPPPEPKQAGPKSTGPSIVVKKADGTTERVPLNSVVRTTTRKKKGPKKRPRLQQLAPPVRRVKPAQSPQPKTATPLPPKTVVKPAAAQPKQEAPAPAKVPTPQPIVRKQPVASVRTLPKTPPPLGEKAQHQDIQKAPETTLSTTTPVTDIFVQKPSHPLPKPSSQSRNAVQWDPDDHKSLLEEDLEGDEATHNGSSSHTDVRVDEIIEKVTVTLSDDQKRRLRPIVISRVKDVRNDEAVYALLMRDTASGGLGLDATGAAQVVAAIGMVLNTGSGKKKRAQQRQARTPQATAPTSAAASLSIASPQPSVERQSAGTKPAMHDIVTPTNTRPKRTVGPVDELLHMSLVDARRLSPDPMKAMQAIRAKFDTLQKESFLLYMQGKNAWFQSPLVRRYQDAIIAALDARQSIPQYLSPQGGGQSLSPEEFHEIVKLNQTL